MTEENTAAENWPKGISIGSLPPSGTGKFKITTKSGTYHILNYEEQSITRYPASGHEWHWEKGTSHEDYKPFYYTMIDGIKVGESFTAKTMSGDWRRSSTILSIEVI